MPVVSFTEVSVRKMGNLILSELNWQVNAGEIWAITGANGAGKSVFLEAIAGSIMPSQGRITRSTSVELVASDYRFDRIIRSAAQYYQQRFQAYDATLAPMVRDVLLRRLRPIGTIDPASVRRSEATVPKEKLLEVARLLKLEHLLDHPFVTLSHGETRRMMLGRSLLKSPGLLLLDSPFTGLDPLARQNLSQIFRDLVSHGTGLVLALAPAEIPTLVTHVVELEGGRIRRSSPAGSWSPPTAQTGYKRKKESILQNYSDNASDDFEYAFSLRNIRVAYGGNTVLKGITWSVACGERWSLSGANGSGKSTLLSIINADNPQRFANRYDIFDRPNWPNGLSMWEVKKRIGHVSPELHLYFPQNTISLIAIASGFFDATGVYFRKISEEHKLRIVMVAEVLGITGLLERELRSLSKGQQRLVMLARAVVKNPPLLILDEPCQGLDTATTEDFNKIVNGLCLDNRRTLIYVTHYQNEIPSCVNRYLRLKDGEVESIRED